jgi:ribosome maturation factor RimP
VDLKLERQGLEKKFFDLCTEIVKNEGLELYGLDYLKGQCLLRLFVQNPETKTAQLEDCAKVDRALTPFVEELEWMPAELTLEVSSPGVYRDIKEAFYFQGLVGERIAFALFEKLSEKDLVADSELSKSGKKLLNDKKVTVYLNEFSEEYLVVSPEKNDMTRVKINIGNIKKANVEPLWSDISEN